MKKFKLEDFLMWFDLFVVVMLFVATFEVPSENRMIMFGVFMIYSGLVEIKIQLRKRGRSVEK